MSWFCGKYSRKIKMSKKIFHVKSKYFLKLMHMLHCGFSIVCWAPILVVIISERRKKKQDHLCNGRLTLSHSRILFLKLCSVQNPWKCMPTNINETQYMYMQFRSFHWMIRFVMSSGNLWININSTQQVLVILFMVDCGQKFSRCSPLQGKKMAILIFHC